MALHTDLPIYRTGVRLQDMPAADLHQSANSYFGLLRQATHSHHDRTRVAKLMLQRSHVVAGDMTKIYRKKGYQNHV